MMTICFKEGVKVSSEAVNDVITGANHDIRQVLHHLSLWSVKDKQLSIENVKEESQRAKKDIKLVSVLCLKVSSISRACVMKKITLCPVWYGRFVILHFLVPFPFEEGKK